MIERRLMTLLLLPSLFSFFTSLTVATAIIGLNGWSYVASSPWLYDFFYGDQGVITIFESSPKVFDSLVTSFGGSSITYAIVISFIAILAGSIGVMAVHAIKRAVLVASELRSESSFERREDIERTVTRIIVTLLWAVYWYCFVQFIMPLCFLLSRVAADNLQSWIAGAYWVASIAALAIAIHIHIIFLRLIALRPRVFGGDADIDAALISR